MNLLRTISHFLVWLLTSWIIGCSIQTCLKYCTSAERNAVYEELRPQCLALAKDKYAYHIVIKMMDNGKIQWSFLIFLVSEQVVDHQLSLAPWLLLMFYFYVGYTGPWALTFDDERSPLICDTCFINYASCDDFITNLSCVAANKIQLQQMLTMLHGNVVALLRHPHASPGLWLLCSCISNLHSGEWVCERVPVVLVLMEYGQRTQWMSSVTFYYCNRS